MESSVSGKGKAACCSEHGNEIPASIKYGEFID